MKTGSIKVLMITRPNLYSVRGGDTIQIMKTAEYLKKLGVEVDIYTEGTINYTNYNLLHFFNVIDPEDILGHLYKSKLPYVLSPIYVDYREYDKYHRNDLIGKLSKIYSRDAVEYFKTLAKFILKGEKVSSWRFFLKGHRASVIHILKNAEILYSTMKNKMVYEVSPHNELSVLNTDPLFKTLTTIIGRMNKEPVI